jgi:NADH-quinone oxidoreductase subunit I
MIGHGMASGLAVTLKHFVRSSRQVLQRPRAGSPDVHQTPLNSEDGIFTVQYPEQRLAPPERFRYIPMLIMDTATGKSKCTSCGICAKVCPPQCIWIVRSSGPDGKPIPEPAEFFIDASICMSCGFCAEYCPFDAIKMNQVYELACTERKQTLLLNKDELHVPIEYHAKIHPLDYAVEEAERKAKEEADRAKAAARARPTPPSPQA